MTYRSPSLADVIATLKVDRVDEHRFLATGDPEPFARLASRFLGPSFGRVPIGVAA